MAKKTTKPPTPLAAWVESLRQANGLSQEAFAEKIGKHRISVHDWEKGASTPDVRSIQAIQRAFPAAPPPPGFTGTNPQAPVQSLRELLTQVLLKRADGMTGTQVLLAQKRIAELAPRLNSVRIDESGAEQLFDVLIEIPLGGK